MTAAEPRLVPAVVGGHQIHIECPVWCTVDHVAYSEGFLEDVWHCGDQADLYAPRIGKTPDLALYARLGLDSFDPDPARRKTFISVDDGSEGFYMAPDQADQFAENLEAFAEQIRAMARTARGAA
ncbi:DUF6907 domain-containing protein [Streptomyces sp. NPDC056387]|uniref:DUF6907 domain-containing protein n=1 Tax=Streptomyces sp. NPDC056387 TaxID=3345803 RepID=UPI0035D9E12C